MACCGSLCTLLGRATVISADNHTDILVTTGIITGHQSTATVGRVTGTAWDLQKNPILEIPKDFLQKAHAGNPQSFPHKNHMLTIPKTSSQKSHAKNQQRFLTEIPSWQSQRFPYRKPHAGNPQKIPDRNFIPTCLQISLLNLLKEIHFTGNDLGKMVILLHVEELAAGLLRAECPSCRRTNNVIIQQIVINK